MARALGLANLLDHQVGGRRNLIINGAMQVAQRGTQETGVTTGGYYTVDRFRFGSDSATFTMDQNTVTDLPGFTKSCKVTCTTAGTPTGVQSTNISVRLEGQDLQHLKKGTSDAESLTLSFWVKSGTTGGTTGTYTVELLDSNNSNRHVGSTFTIDASDTWEYKTLTFAGDTTGAFTNDNNRSLSLTWFLSAGGDFKTGTLQTSWGAYAVGNRVDGNQVDLASGNDSAVNYLEITGVQLEVGETATPFEHRSYGEELALCQRYYTEATTTTTGGGYILGVASGMAWNASNVAGMQIMLPVEMRATPTLTTSFTTPGVYSPNRGFSSGTIGLGSSSNKAVQLNVSGSSGLTTSEQYYLYESSASFSRLKFYAEL